MQNKIPIIIVVIVLAVFITAYFTFRGEPPSEALISESDEVRNLREQAARYTAAADYEQAIAAYTEALHLRPENAYFHNNLGAVYYNIGVDAAEPWEEDVTDKTPFDALNQLQQALSQLKSGIIVMKVNDADVMNILENHARSIRAYVHTEHHQRTSDVNIITGKTMEAFRKAESEFWRAKDLKPGYAVPYESLGALYYRMGRHRDALTQWRNALELEPNNKRLRRYLSQF